jgi:hypothetical protein
MPLTACQPNVTNYPDRSALGFWMIAESGPVLVFVSYAVLEALAPLKPWDLPSKFETFEARRDVFEQIASEKFDTGSIESEPWSDSYRQFPIVVVSNTDV